MPKLFSLACIAIFSQLCCFQETPNVFAAYLPRYTSTAAQGTRIRYTLDRDSTLYKDTYKERTAVERINSQAVALGIERPHLRNGRAIANQSFYWSRFFCLSTETS